MRLPRFVTALSLAGSLSICGSSLASPFRALPPSAHAFFGREKMVQFEVRNDTSAPLKLKLGDDAVTLDPGKSKALKLPVGTKITLAEAAGRHVAGEVLAQAGTELNGTTIAVH